MRGRCRWAQKCGGTPQPLAALATAPSPALVIARSDSDEAIQLPREPLDCFADARNDDMDFILPREAGKGDHPAQQGGGRGVGLQASSAARPLHHPSGGPPPPHFVRGRIKRNRSRDALTRPSFANHDDAKNRFASGNQRGKRSAERRMPSMSASAQTSVRELAPLIRSAAARPQLLPPPLAGEGQGRARPPFGAHACGTRHRLSPRWLSPRTGFPEDGLRECFARSARLSSVKHAPRRPVFVPVDRGPRAARERIGISARGHRPSLSSFRLALPERRPQ